jgi:hypothetical protein
LKEGKNMYPYPMEAQKRTGKTAYIKCSDLLEAVGRWLKQGLEEGGTEEMINRIRCGIDGPECR